MALCLMSLSLTLGCAANPSPDPTAPRSGDAAYPNLLTDENGERREAALAAWAAFTRDQGVVNAPPPELHPVTATVRSIPVLPQSSLYLPRIGDSAPMNEEEMREALRRFINYAGPLLCAEPQQLSLIERVDGADGVKEVRYQQRPFRYGLRGGFGELKIGFTSDRRITRISSTCLPDTDRIRRSFVGLSQQRIPAEKVVENLAGRSVTDTGANGQQQTFTFSGTDKVKTRDLVIYPIERTGEPPALEIHSAWEITLESAPGLTFYVDSILGEVLGVVSGQPN